MHLEIERKFLVKSDEYKNSYLKKYDIVQGFLNKDKNRTVRIRLKNNKGFITVKGISSKDGRTRLEWEKEIEPGEAKNLLNLCHKPLLSKTRFEILFEGKIFEVDEFHENHQGLVIAEIELKTADENFKKPNWLGEEVTGDPEYYNSQL